VKPLTQYTFCQNFNQPTIATSSPASQQKVMPHRNERDLWWDFFAGEPESLWSQPRAPKRKNKEEQLREHEVLAKDEIWVDQGDINEEQYESRQNPECLFMNPPLAPDESTDFNIVVDESEVEKEPKIEFRISLLTPIETLELPNIAATLLSEELIEGVSSQTYAPREPTPHLLKLMDEVSRHLISASMTSVGTHMLLSLWRSIF